MRRLGAVLLLVLLVAGMNVRSVWSGGGKWGSGTPSGARTDAYWLPDAQTPTGKPFPDVAIDGELLTHEMQSASWGMGPSDYLSSLSPGAASFSFLDYFVVPLGSTVVVTSASGTLWVGRVDTVSTTWDEASNAWTTITATDPIGALGAAELLDQSAVVGTDPDLEGFAQAMAAVGGITLDVVDASASGLPNITANYPITGSLLGWINDHAIRSNAMLGLQRDGTVKAVVREGVTPTDQVDITDRYRRWTQTVSLDVDINQWQTVNGSVFGVDAEDVALYGQRPYSIDFDKFAVGSSAHFDDWIAYGGSQRPTVVVEFPVSSWSDDDIMLLNPFDWVTEGANDWQVMSVQHSVTASPYSWTVSITADNLLDLL